MSSKIIMHVDMNAFFAAVAERENPSLRGKPVIVGASLKEGRGRGIVNTGNYESRKFGIYSGMPVSKAYRLCPNGVFLEPDFELVKQASESVMQILREYADRFEQGGIDEAYMDVSQRCGNFSDAKALAYLLKEKIFESESLTCSIGIAPNKLVAKVASDFKKPDGLTVVEPDKVREFLFPLPVDRLLGIGKKSKLRLESLGIKTIGDLANYDIDRLTQEFGQFGIYYHQAAHGMSESEVTEDWIQKSFSRERTFERDVDDRQRIFDAVDALAEKVHEDLLAYKIKFSFKNVSIKVRYASFETHTSAKTLIAESDDVRVIKRTARDLMRYFVVRDKIRLVGVKVSELSEEKGSKKIMALPLNFAKPFIN